MSLVLNTNINSLIAQNSLTTSGGQLTTALQQLSSGLQINTAADNAAGYAISQGMTSQINGLNQAAQNANDGVSLAQTAQGALTEITNDLQTMRDLAVQSLNGTNSSQDRADLNQQFKQLSADINQVASTASFNGVMLLDGTFQGQTFQIGANAGQTITVASVASVATSNLGQLYTSTAVDPANYTSNGNSTTAAINKGTAVANGDSGAFTITIGSGAGAKTLTANVNLTGTQSSDLSTIAAAITQATGSNGVVATVDSAGTGLQLSSTTQQSVSISYAPTTGSESLTTFGLAAAVAGAGATSTTLNLSGTSSYAATGTAATDSLTSGSAFTATGAAGTDTLGSQTAGATGTYSIVLGGTTYTTGSLTLTGTGSSDLNAVVTGLNADAAFTAAGFTASASGGELKIASTSASATSVGTQTFTGTGPGTVSGSLNFGGLTTIAANSSATSTSVSDTLATTVAGATGAYGVTINGATYTTGSKTFGGTLAADLNTAVTGLNANAAFSAAGYVAKVDSAGTGLEITNSKDTSAFTVTSQAFTAASPPAGTTYTGSLDLGFATSTTASGTAPSTGTVSVTIGANTYTTADIAGFNGNTVNDMSLIVSALNAPTAKDGGGSSLASQGYTASVNSQNELVITGGNTTFTASAAYTADAGTSGSVSFGTLSTASTSAAAASTLASASVDTIDASNKVLIQIDAALQQLATTGAQLGAYQNRFQAAITGLQTDATNLSAAKSQIVDTNYAQATSSLSKAQILQQASTAMVAQANMIPQQILSLLQKLP